MSDRPPKNNGEFDEVDRTIPVGNVTADEVRAMAAAHPVGITTEVEPVPARHQTLVKRFRLAILGGPDAGNTYSSSSPSVIVGTHQSADLVLHDRAVSRFHCDVSLQGGRAFVRDLGSRNGTLVDGVSIIHSHLHSGAMLTLGRTQIRFDLGPDHVAIPLSGREQFGLMVGRSAAMRAVFVVLERAAESDATVLLEGETGTGKEVAAESIHRESTRREGPFIVVDCGAIPPDLLESELFGHERGAFTGAISARQGAFKAASGGTIFLDEIGELTADLQPKLLRALERREVKRVGSDRYEPIDVRVVAATNRNLRAEVNAQRFRSDLYYRLAVLQVRLPPLRERLEDLALLIENLLNHLGVADQAESAPLRSNDFIAQLARHPWPGNVRELRNYVERCLAMRETPPLAETGTTEPAADPYLDLPVDVSQPMREARERLIRAFERKYIEEILHRHNGNVTAAARASGVDRAFFYRLLYRHGMR
jgi:DNA-binding NtrC family response regulator